MEAELWSGNGLQIHRLCYHAERYTWSDDFVPEDNGVVFARHGAYRRRSDGVEHLVDANTGFFRRAGEEVSAANFTGEPEELTMIRIDKCVLDSILAEPSFPTGPFSVTPEIDFAHRLLLREIKHDPDDVDVETRALELIVAVVGQQRADWVRGSRASTEESRRSLVNDACELLHVHHGDISLQALARSVGCSPFHLSRVFREGTGCTISQYRLRRRVHEVLDRLAAGEDDLAALAIAVGFSDHSHMTRTVVAQLGKAPSELRRRLSLD
jgi:AraC-like DNA-binding protein